MLDAAADKLYPAFVKLAESAGCDDATIRRMFSTNVKAAYRVEAAGSGNASGSSEAKTTALAEQRPTKARLAMYGLTAGVTMINFLLRNGIPNLVPFIVEEQGYSASEAALLLAGFFPGYMITQVPGGWASQRFGAKVVNSLNVGGQALFLVLLPAAAKLGVTSVAVVLTCLGMCQGPLVPAQAVVQRHWLPAGPERAWVSRLTQVGQRIGKIVTTVSTPWLASTRGWRSVPYVYAACTGAFWLAWCAFAANTPREWSGRPRMNEAEIKLLEDGTAAGSKKKKKPAASSTSAVAAAAAAAAKSGGGGSTPWWKVGAAQSIILMHIAANATEYTLTQWAPTYFIEMHGVNPAQLGQFLALPQTVAFFATFGTAAVEDLVLRAGVPLLTVRKIAGLGGSCLHAIFLLAFGLVKTPQQSMLAYCGVTATQCVYGSGHIPNYMEVGAGDVGVMKAVGNTVANAPGVLIPVLGVWLRQRFGGSFLPLLGLIGGFQVFTGLVYAVFASTDSAATILQERAAAKSR